jgi:hypothetical protein
MPFHVYKASGDGKVDLRFCKLMVNSRSLHPIKQIGYAIAFVFIAIYLVSMLYCVKEKYHVTISS